MEARSIVSIGSPGKGILFVDGQTTCKSTGNGLVFENIDTGVQVWVNLNYVNTNQPDFVNVSWFYRALCLFTVAVSILWQWQSWRGLRIRDTSAVLRPAFSKPRKDLHTLIQYFYRAKYVGGVSTSHWRSSICLTAASEALKVLMTQIYRTPVIFFDWNKIIAVELAGLACRGRLDLSGIG